MDYNVYLSNISDTFITSWNVPYPSEGVQREYFCPDSYYSEFNFTQQPLPTRPESHFDGQNLLELGHTSYINNWQALHSSEDLQPKHYVQLDSICQEFNLKAHSTSFRA